MAGTENVDAEFCGALAPVVDLRPQNELVLDLMS